MSSDTQIKTSFLACFLTVLALGMYYTILGSSFKFSTNGELIDANVFIESGENSNSYYRNEIFQYKHDGHNTTCTLRRPWYFMYYGDAENAVKDTILHTNRKIWIASYSFHVCSDISLKTYNLTIGTTLLSMLGACFVVPIVVLVGIYIWEKLKQNFNDRVRLRDSNNNWFSNNL